MLDGNEILKNVSLYKSAFLGSLKQFGPQIINTDPDEKQRAWEYVTQMVTHGAYIYWDTAIMATACSGSSHFVGTKFPLCNPAIQVWVQSLNGMMTSFTSGEQVIGQIIDHRNGGISIWEIVLRDMSCGSQIAITKIAVIHDDSDAIRESEGVLLQIAAGLEFMCQPFVDIASLDKVSLISGAHQQQKRNDAKNIRVVYLRRREQHPTLQDGSPNPVDWSCQWLVKGHWRNQYLPSTKEHKPKFIQSYVKGPEDKPFRASAGSIFAAVR